MITYEFCQEVITEVIAPLADIIVARELAKGRQGRHIGSLLIAQSVTKASDMSNTDYYSHHVIYEHTFGDNEIGPDQLEDDTFTVDIAYAGLWFCHDLQLTEATASVLQADITRRGLGD